MRIRRAMAEDAPSMAVVTTRAYDLYEVLLGYLPPPATEDPLSWIEAGEAWVGERDSEVMAVLLAQVKEAHLLVRSAVVDPDWQGEGHGRALLDHAEALARERQTARSAADHERADGAQHLALQALRVSGDRAA